MKSISVIMATLNSGAILDRCLQSIRNQDYDQSKVEIICADGGSSDSTRSIVHKHHGKVIKENTHSPEGAKAIALKHAINDIILEVDDDTILPDQYWLTKMVECLNSEPQAVGCYTWRYSYQPNDHALNRYFSLFGANDPVAYFLKRTDRQSYLADHWTLAGKIKDKGSYFLVSFTANNLPTVGANGFLIHRRLLQKAQVDETHFFHIDVNKDLNNLGFTEYVVVKNDVIHASGESVWHFFAKRKRYMEELYLRDTDKRRYFLYDKNRDRKRIVLYSVYALTLVGPLIESVRGYRRIADLAWFFHPLVCFIMFWIYFWAVVNWQCWFYLGTLKKRINRRTAE